MGLRRQARIVALNVLYLVDVSGINLEDAKKFIFNHSNLNGNLRKFANALIDGTYSNKAKLDKLISQVVKNWRIERIVPTDRNILRMAAFELMMGETPEKVVINEAIEIAKKFSTEKSGKFINGVLDKVRLILKDGYRES